jgi:hypothetical protein
MHSGVTKSGGLRRSASALTPSAALWPGTGSSGPEYADFHALSLSDPSAVLDAGPISIAGRSPNG